MFNKMIASILPLMPQKFVWIFSKIYIAGQSLNEAIVTAKKLNKEGNADYLVFTGDLIHGYPGYPDKSLEIIEDMMNSTSNFIALLGNHDPAN